MNKKEQVAFEIKLFNLKPGDEQEFALYIGKRLKHLRKRTGTSQAKLGKAWGLHQTAIARIEKGTQLLTPGQFLEFQRLDLILSAMEFAEKALQRSHKESKSGKRILGRSLDTIDSALAHLELEGVDPNLLN